MLRNPTKFTYKLIVRLYIASRKIEIIVYILKSQTYLKIKDSISNQGRMDIVGGATISAYHIVL